VEGSGVWLHEPQGLGGGSAATGGTTVQGGVPFYTEMGGQIFVKWGKITPVSWERDWSEEKGRSGENVGQGVKEKSKGTADTGHKGGGKNL